MIKFNALSFASLALIFSALSVNCAVAMTQESFKELALRCAPSVAPDTLEALVKTESSFNPFAIGVVGGSVKQPKNLQDAILIVTRLVAEKRNFSVGLGQVNQANFSSLGLTAEELFEPCTNLKASAQILSKCYARMSKKGLGEAQALSDALSCYYSGNDVTGYKHGYVHRVTQNSINKTAVKVPSISLLTDSPPLSSQISSSAKSTEKASAQDDPLLRASQAKQAKGEQVQDKLIF